MLGLDVGTVIALVAMFVSLFGAGIKFIDRRRQLNKDQKELTKKEAISDVERDSFVVRGAEGALLLMEKTLKTANDECARHINELEEENADLRCELSNLRVELKEMKAEMKELTRRVDNG